MDRVSTVCMVLFLLVSLSYCDDNDDGNPGRSDPHDLVDPLNLPYYEMANWFLSIVQLSYLYHLEETLGIEFKTYTDFWKDDINESWEDLTVYFIGYTLCVAVGVFLIIAVPLAGCIVACCRCCGNCGGGEPKYGKKPSDCRRFGCGFGLLFVTLVIGFGVAGVFIANETMRDRLEKDHSDKNMFTELQSSIESIEQYTQTSMKELNISVVGGYSKGVKELNDALNKLPNDGLMAINADTNVVDDMGVLTGFTNSLPYTSELMATTDQDLNDLNSTLVEIEDQLLNITQDIMQVIEVCITQQCNDSRDVLSNLTVVLNTNGISFADAKSAMDNSTQDGIIDLVSSSENELESIETDIETNLKPQIDKINVLSTSKQVDLISYVDDINDIIEDIDFNGAANAVDEAASDVNDYYVYAYASVLTLGVIICVTLLCNVIGVFAGFICPRPDSEDGGCRSDTLIGAQFLLAGLVFTFVFYWLYTLIVASMFIAGGVTHTEFCRHAVEYDNEKSEKVLVIFDRVINTTLTEQVGFELELFALYKTCENDESFYTALDIASRGYNLTEIVDFSDISSAVKDIENSDFNISSITLINDTTKDILTTLDSELDKLDFIDIKEQLNTPVISESIDDVVDIINSIRDYDLASYITKLNNLQMSYIEPAENLTNDILVNVSTIENNIAVNLTSIALNFESAQNVIDMNGSVIIEDGVKVRLDEIAVMITKSANDIEKDVIDNVGKCYPFYQAFTEAIDASCVKTLYPFNAFWYALGWILFFLIPSIILSFCLITEYQVPTSFSYVEDDPTTYDAFTNPSLDRALVPQSNLAASDKTNVNEFDNPVYNEANYHIPRPSLKSKEPNPDYDNGTSMDTDSIGSDFRLPRPKLYNGANATDSPPSYRSLENSRQYSPRYSSQM